MKIVGLILNPTIYTMKIVGYGDVDGDERTLISAQVVSSDLR